MTAFQESLKAGADGIETDVHLSQDGVVVISHDETTLRCYGVPGLVSQQNYHGQMDTYRTVDEPRSSMPTLRAVLDLLSEKVYDSKWLLIDIKVDNSTAVIKGIYRTLCEINPDMKYWASRVILGIWHAKFMPYCKRHMPQLPITHIGLHLSYAGRYFLHSPQVSSFNMQIYSLYGKEGREFVKTAQSMGKSVFVWTVNDENTMRWSMSLQVDAILTDDPTKCNKVLGQDIEKWDSSEFWTLKQILRVQLWRLVLLLVQWHRVWKYRNDS